MYSARMNTEVVQQFWEALQQGVFITEAAEKVGTYREMGTRWLAAAGGIRPRRGRDLKGRCLSLREREEIAVARAAGEPMRSIAARLGRSPSTISRELGRNSERGGRYRATSAHAAAYQRAGRPKPSKLHADSVLRQRIQQDLTRHYSPEQIVGRLRLEYPNDASMRVSVETIYRALYLPGGGLHRDLTRRLRTGRRLRRPRRQPAQRKNRILDMVNIRYRPGRGRRPLDSGELGRRSDPRPQQPLRDRHPGRAGHRCHRAGPSARRLQTAPAARTLDPPAVAAAGAVAPIADLGPGTTDARLERRRRRDRNRHLLLRSALAVAAAREREHERVAAPILSQGQRSERAHRR